MTDHAVNHCRKLRPYELNPWDMESHFSLANNCSNDKKTEFLHRIVTGDKKRGPLRLSKMSFCVFGVTSWVWYTMRGFNQVIQLTGHYIKFSWEFTYFTADQNISRNIETSYPTCLVEQELHPIITICFGLYGMAGMISTFPNMMKSEIGWICGYRSNRQNFAELG